MIFLGIGIGIIISFITFVILARRLKDSTEFQQKLTLYWEMSIAQKRKELEAREREIGELKVIADVLLHDNHLRRKT